MCPLFCPLSRRMPQDKTITILLPPLLQPTCHCCTKSLRLRHPTCVQCSAGPVKHSQPLTLSVSVHLPSMHSWACSCAKSLATAHLAVLASDVIIRCSGRARFCALVMAPIHSTGSDANHGCNGRLPRSFICLHGCRNLCIHVPRNSKDATDGSNRASGQWLFREAHIPAECRNLCILHQL